MAADPMRRDFIAATKPDLEPMAYFAEMAKGQNLEQESKPELTEAQQITREKVEHLQQDPNATRRDMVSAEAAVHFNDRAHGQGIESENDPKEEKGKGAAGEKDDRESDRDKPEPELKPDDRRPSAETGLSADALEALAGIEAMNMATNRQQEQNRGMSMGM